MKRMLKAKISIAGTVLLIVYSVLLNSCKQTGDLAPSFIPHPNDASKKVEYYLKQPKGKGPWPAIVFIHGQQVGSKPGGSDFVKWGVLDQFTHRGFVAVAISQPGYGASNGPPDYCGEFTQNAVIAVLKKIENEGIVKQDQIILEGISRGAVVAGLVAAKEPSIKGIILISGVFDFIKYKAEAETEAPKKLIINSATEETANSEDSLKSRSVINFAHQIKASTLILNGENDEKTSPEQARELAEKINASGGNASFVIFKNTGHNIPGAERNKIIDPFISKVLK